MPWRIEDYVVWRGQTPPNASEGPLVLPCQPSGQVVPTGYVWRVTGLTVMCSSPVTGIQMVADVYDLDPTAALAGALVPVADTTKAGQKDICDRGSAIIIPAGGGVWVVWRTADVGAVGAVRMQYELATRTGSAARRPVAF